MQTLIPTSTHTGYALSRRALLLVLVFAALPTVNVSAQSWIVTLLGADEQRRRDAAAEATRIREAADREATRLREAADREATRLREDAAREATRIAEQSRQELTGAREDMASTLTIAQEDSVATWNILNADPDRERSLSRAICKFFTGREPGNRCTVRGGGQVSSNGTVQGTDGSGNVQPVPAASEDPLSPENVSVDQLLQWRAESDALRANLAFEKIWLRHADLMWLRSIGWASGASSEELEVAPPLTMTPIAPTESGEIRMGTPGTPSYGVGLVGALRRLHGLQYAHGGTDYSSDPGEPIFAVVTGIARYRITQNTGYPYLEIQVGEETHRVIYIDVDATLAERIGASEDGTIRVNAGERIGTAADLHAVVPGRYQYPASVENHVHVQHEVRPGVFVSPSEHVVIRSGGNREDTEIDQAICGSNRCYRPRQTSPGAYNGRETGTANPPPAESTD